MLLAISGGAMSVDWVQPLSGWLPQSDPSSGYLLLHLNNYKQLLGTYGSTGFWNTLVSAFEERLKPYGVTANDMLVLDQLVLIGLGGLTLSISMMSQDRFLEHIKAVLSYEPVEFESSRVLVTVLATWIEKWPDTSVTGRGFFSGMHTAAKAIAFAEIESQQNQQTRSDMALASQLFEDMRDTKVVLAFQPVILIADDHQVLYYEALLRSTVAGDDDRAATSCESAVLALERLHSVERLDASVLWAVIRELEQYPDIHLACNISPLSLQHGTWWRLIISALANDPDLASRLTLEITETAAVFDLDEAINLLSTLRILGCKIAIDDIGTGFSTLELATQIRPDTIKIDKTLVRDAREQGGLALLHSWIETSLGLSKYVVAEGIETDKDLQSSIGAGANAVQGHFIQSPSIQPPWGAFPVCVQDCFNPNHRNVAIQSMS